MAIPTPVSFWNLDESSGNATDATATGNTLTNINTVAYTTGLIGNAADFEKGSTQGLAITDGAQSGLDITGTLSFAYWMKAESALADNYAMGKYQVGGANSRSWANYINSDAGGTFYFTGSADGGTSTQDMNWAFNPSTGVWYHICLTYNGSGTGILYIDGVSQGSDTFASITTLPNSSSPFNVGNVTGAGGNGTVTTQGFDGLMDMVGIWNVVLTAGEVSELYNAGAGKQYPFTSGPQNIASRSGVTASTINTFDTVSWASIDSISGTT